MICAWCQKEKGVTAKPEESHGICQKHYDDLLAEDNPKAQRERLPNDLWLP